LLEIADGMSTRSLFQEEDAPIARFIPAKLDLSGRRGRRRISGRPARIAAAGRANGLAGIPGAA
jgi:hypothetical protein